MTKLSVGALLVAVLALGVGFYGASQAGQNAAVLDVLHATLKALSDGASKLGAMSQQNPERLEVGSLVTGNTGVETVSAAATTTTLTAAQLCSGKTILWSPNVTNSTATLPTTVSLVRDCLPRVGMALTFQMRNASATSIYNVVKGTGQTVYHVNEAATSTAQATTIGSSTPTFYTLKITLASGTDSTAEVFQYRFLTP